MVDWGRGIWFDLLMGGWLRSAVLVSLVGAVMFGVGYIGMVKFYSYGGFDSVRSKIGGQIRPSVTTMVSGSKLPQPVVSGAAKKTEYREYEGIGMFYVQTSFPLTVVSAVTDASIGITETVWKFEAGGKPMMIKLRSGECKIVYPDGITGSLGMRGKTFKAGDLGLPRFGGVSKKLTVEGSPECKKLIEELEPRTGLSEELEAFFIQGVVPVGWPVETIEGQKVYNPQRWVVMDTVTKFE